MPWPLYPRERDLVPVVHEVGWTPVSVWTGVENRTSSHIFSNMPLFETVRHVCCQCRAVVL